MDRPKRLAHEYLHESFRLFGLCMWDAAELKTNLISDRIRFTSFWAECPLTNYILVTSFEMNGEVDQRRKERNNFFDRSLATVKSSHLIELIIYYHLLVWIAINHNFQANIVPLALNTRALSVLIYRTQLSAVHVTLCNAFDRWLIEY